MDIGLCIQFLNIELACYYFRVIDFISKLIVVFVVVYLLCSLRFGKTFQGITWREFSLVSNSLESVGAHTASGFHIIVGLELKINHLSVATLGEHVYAKVRPIIVGKRI